MQHFTRRETVILTRTSPSRLAYLARIGVVVPEIDEDDVTQPASYSWEQILELRTIRHLRRQTSLQMIRKVLAFLEGTEGDRTLHNKHLIVADGEVKWVKIRSDVGLQVVQVADKDNRHVGQLQLMALPPFSNLADHLWQTSQRPKVVPLDRSRHRVVPLHPR
ncbi:MAG: MerR family transcriptional regulator [Leptolyngbyaceae cyanobacterium]